jgi:hypothetical protein
MPDDLSEYSKEPWGSWKNMAADQLGLWEWHGERDSAGHPCRYRMRYSCNCEQLRKTVAKPVMDMNKRGPYHWTLEWSWITDDECHVCGVTTNPHEVEDLLLDLSVCPVNEDD